MPRRSPEIIARSRELRQSVLPSEKRLWQAIKAVAKGKVHVRRQHFLAGYYLDFYCAKARLALEVDGASHEFSQERDARRDAQLRALGITTIRLPASEVRQGADSIAEAFVSECLSRLPPA